jgi:hypothetical protein
MLFHCTMWVTQVRSAFFPKFLQTSDWESGLSRYFSHLSSSIKLRTNSKRRLCSALPMSYLSDRAVQLYQLSKRTFLTSQGRAQKCHQRHGPTSSEHLRTPASGFSLPCTDLQNIHGGHVRERYTDPPNIAQLLGIMHPNKYCSYLSTTR